MLRSLSFAATVYGPRGSRTHYRSIKSRELIPMSFRPDVIMLRPRLELGSRTDLVLARYKLAALPIELPEQFKQLVCPYGLEPSSYA